jgi:uncharacterized protein (TIGR02679 family)
MTEAAARFGRPELEPLWREARRRFEASDVPVTRLSLRGLTLPQRSALADLLGLAHTPGTEISISVPRLDTILLSSPVALDTRGVVVALGGPLVDRAAERRRSAAARDELWQWLATHPVVHAEPALEPWVAWTRSVGVVGGSIEATRALLERAVAVLATLPGRGETLPAFAAAVCGDPHALDDGTRLSAYVMRALSVLDNADAPAGAEERRAMWQRAGIACDELSTVVLVAGLRPSIAGGPLATVLRAWSDAGEACAVTLAQLRSAVPIDAEAVFVVENPSVLASAVRRFGSRCPGLVCVSGWPNTAAVTLLRQLAARGAALRYHGDFDGDGVRIAAHVMAKTGAVPWRMSARDYLAAVPAAGPPVGRVSEAPWDAELAAAMRTRGVSVPEELVTDVLLADMTALVSDRFDRVARRPG